MKRFSKPKIQYDFFLQAKTMNLLHETKFIPVKFYKTQTLQHFHEKNFWLFDESHCGKLSPEMLFRIEPQVSGLRRAAHLTCVTNGQPRKEKLCLFCKPPEWWKTSPKTSFERVWNFESLGALKNLKIQIFIKDFFWQNHCFWKPWSSKS